MNTIFIDTNSQSKNLFEKTVFKILKFNFKGDIIEKNLMYFRIDENFITNTKKNKYKIRKFIFKKFLKYILKEKEDINIVFSKKIDEDVILKENLFDIFNKITKTSEINVQNTMKKNDMKYIENFVIENKINLSKLKILVIVDKKNDYSKEKIIEYISKYKFVDILKTTNIDKVEYKYLQNEVLKINDEYGSTIDIIQKRNISMYNIYIFFSDIDKNKFKEHYILKTRSKCISLNNPDEDYLSSAFKYYEKNKYEIETLFNRIGIEVDNFGKNKLGCFIKKNSL